MERLENDKIGFARQWRNPPNRRLALILSLLFALFVVSSLLYSHYSAERLKKEWLSREAAMLGTLASERPEWAEEWIGLLTASGQASPNATAQGDRLLERYGMSATTDSRWLPAIGEHRSRTAWTLLLGGACFFALAAVLLYRENVRQSRVLRKLAVSMEDAVKRNEPISYRLYEEGDIGLLASGAQELSQRLKSPVDAAKGAGGIVRESYRRARIPSLLHLIGVEGRMASNNIRRNRTKFRITTFSIVISIMLFIVFHYFTQQTLTITTTTNEDDRIAFQLYRNALPDKAGNAPSPEERIPDELMEEIGALPGVEAVYGVYDAITLPFLVPEAKLNGDSRTAATDYEKTYAGGEESNRIPARVQIYDEARLKQASKYLHSGTADPARLSEDDNVLLIQTIRPRMDNGKNAIMDLTRYKVGDRIALWTNADSDGEEPDIREVTVAGILTESPFDASYHSSMPTIIGTRSTFAKLLEAAAGAYPSSEYDAERHGLEIALRDGADMEPIRAKLRDIARAHPGSRLIDFAENQKEARNFNIQMRIYVYGFLVVIGVIGSLNIINTVQTNLLLRRREIGLLQAVGMTMGQIRKMATAEGIWFGVIGSFWGILLGAGFCYFLYGQLRNVQSFPFEFPWGASLIACAAALFVGVISVQGPLRRMEKANLLEELREEA